MAKSLEFETGYMQSPALLKRDADTYLLAFAWGNNDLSGDGYFSSFNISADGETLTETTVNGSNRWRFESSDYYSGSWAQVDNNTYALAYWDYNDGGYLHVYDISDDAATVTLKKDFRFSETTNRWDGYWANILKLGSDIYIIAYQDLSLIHI